MALYLFFIINFFMMIYWGNDYLKDKEAGPLLAFFGHGGFILLGIKLSLS